MRKQLLIVLIVVTVVGLALVSYPAFATPKAVSNLTLQVNPAINLVLSDKNTVIAAEGLDAQGDSLLEGLDIVGKETPEALRLITDALREAGFLGPEQRILIALHPIEQRLGEAELTALAKNIHQTLDEYLAGQGLLTEVKIVVLTTEVADAVFAAGLLPADYIDDYIDLIAAVGPESAMWVINLQNELGLDRIVFNEEVSTITAALIDMMEAGITKDAALDILNRTLVVDPTLEELATIIAAMIDLHEAGAMEEDIIAVFKLVEEQVAAGMNRALILEEITTITAAKVDMLDAGIPAETALATIKKALQADPTLEELTTITAKMIDLHEKGLSREEALSRIQAAITADPTLEDFDELVEETEIGQPQRGRQLEQQRDQQIEQEHEE